MSPMNPPGPEPTTPAKLVAALGRSREVVIFALGLGAGALLVVLGRLT